MGAWKSLRNFITGNDIKAPNGGYFYPLGMAYDIQHGGHDLDYVQKNALLYTIITKYADYVCNAKFEVRNDKDEIVENDPLITLLNRPNELQTQKEYLRSWLFQMKLDGVAWINTISGVGFETTPEKTQLIVLPCLEPVKSYDARHLALNPELLETLKFNYTTENGIVVPLTMRELIPCVDSTSSARTPFEYLSPIKAAALIAANSNLRLEADNILTDKPMGLGIMSSQVQNMSGMAMPINPTEKKEIETKLSNSYGMSRGKSQVIVSSAALKYQSIAQTIKDFDLSEGTDRDYMAACNVLGIPKDLIIKDSTYENYVSNQIDFYQNGASNSLEIFCDCHNNKFQYREQGKRLTFTFDHLPVMFKLKKEQAQYKNTLAEFYQKALDMGADASTITERINELL